MPMYLWKLLTEDMSPHEYAKLLRDGNKHVARKITKHDKHKPGPCWLLGMLLNYLYETGEKEKAVPDMAEWGRELFVYPHYMDLAEEWDGRAGLLNAAAKRERIGDGEKYNLASREVEYRKMAENYRELAKVSKAARAA